MPGEGTYVLGVEPANCRTEGRAAERERGTLQVLQPNESRTYTLTFSIYEGPEAIDQLVESIQALG